MLCMTDFRLLRFGSKSSLIVLLLVLNVSSLMAKCFKFSPPVAGGLINAFSSVWSPLIGFRVRLALTLRGVNLDQVLQFARVSRHRAAMVRLHVRVDAPITEDEPGRGEHRGVCAEPPTQRAAGNRPRSLCALIGRGLSLVPALFQVERRRRSGQGGEGLHSVLVLRGVPPLQELQEEDAHGEGGGEGEGGAPRCL